MTDKPADALKPDALDHDHDGRKGGSAPTPELVHAVVVKADEDRGLVHGEVIATTDAEVKRLIHAHVVRPATDDEVQLAQPRVRLWTA